MGVSHSCATTRVRRLRHGCAVAFRAGRTVAPENCAVPRSHQVCRQHFASRLGQADEGSVRDGRLGADVSTLLAPTLQPQLLKVALQNLFWGLNCPGEGGPRSLMRLPASTHGSPRSLRDQSFLVKEGQSAASSTPRQAAREVPQTALSSMQAWSARQWATVCRPALLSALVPGRPTSSRRKEPVELAVGTEGPGQVAVTFPVHTRG